MNSKPIRHAIDYSLNDEIIDKDTKYSYICDTLVDETLKLYDVFYRDVRFE